jgi:hypothetical protein
MLPPPPVVLRERHVEGDRGPDPIRDIRDELRTWPYDIVSGCRRLSASHTAGLRDRHSRCACRRFAAHHSFTARAVALTVIAYFQPATRMQIDDVLGKAGQPRFDRGATLRWSCRHGPAHYPYTYVTTNGFLQLSDWKACASGFRPARKGRSARQSAATS